MKQLVTTGIILGRINFGEADRIITLITPGYGKLRLLAKGVRRIKSKLAGGVELFSVSQITFIKGRGEIGTLISSRLDKYYRNIVTNLDRTMLGYEIIKQLNKATEEGVGKDFFELLRQSFAALDDPLVSPTMVRLWFKSQLLDLSGRGLNLQTDINGNKLQGGDQYRFSLDHMAFQVSGGEGCFTADHIKILRVARDYAFPALTHIRGAQELAQDFLEILESI